MLADAPRDPRRANDALRAWQRPEGARPFVLGHRGARHAAPENTSAAFELARSEGADGIELDVRLDGSGQVIVLHDPTLKRVTSGSDTRHAEDIPSRELSRLDVGKGERVPSLAEVLSWAREHGQRVNVELKSDVRNRVLLLHQVARVVRRQALPSVIFSSFHPYFVWWLARRVPELPRAWLVHEKQHLLKYAPGLRRLGANALHPEHVLASEKRVARLKREHFLVNTWTVNDPLRAKELARIGVDAIISDRPGQILAALSSDWR
ncbi:MAG TPA: glycerophosphodiester phosphodiesterase family protein [Polyangiaceae bacterium]|nr:glycerophosphodiester phosphodiesterase family protein [Polyangiaceae bacterium]